jgi:CubicO group peptidase (beta-lactamase class C family)
VVKNLVRVRAGSGKLLHVRNQRRVTVMTHTFVAVASALVAVACAPPPPPAPAPLPEPKPVESKPADQICFENDLTPYIESINLGWPDAYRPTGMVLAAAKGKTLYSRAFGFADRWHGVSPTENTSFRIGSLTKAFTAVAVLQLVQAGKLRLDGKIGDYLPEYPNVGRHVTLHQLLTHTSGIPNFTDFPEYVEWRQLTVQPRQILEWFWDRPLEFEPGSQYRYSNSGYQVLGAIIERVSGQKYAEYLEQHVFAPAGLGHTVVGDAAGFKDRALGYRATPTGELQLAGHVDMSVAFAAGGIRSSAADLARWHTALSGDALLNQASRARMVQPDKDDYAYGWIVQERGGLEVHSHEGGISGFSSRVVRVPSLDLVIVVLSNTEDQSTKPISDAALACARGEHLTPLPIEGPTELEATARTRLLGEYALTDSARRELSTRHPAHMIESISGITMLEKDGALTMKPSGQGSLRVVAVSPSAVVVKAIELRLDFDLPEDSGAPARGLVLRQSGLEIQYERRVDAVPKPR